MPGNEMTAAFFAAAAFAAHLRNESRNEPTLAGDAFTGVLAGLAMLAKFTDVIACLAIAALTGLRWLRSGDVRGQLPRIGLRALALAAPLLLTFPAVLLGVVLFVRWGVSGLVVGAVLAGAAAFAVIVVTGLLTVGTTIPVADTVRLVAMGAVLAAAGWFVVRRTPV